MQQLHCSTCVTQLPVCTTLDHKIKGGADKHYRFGNISDKRLMRVEFQYVLCLSFFLVITDQTLTSHSPKSKVNDLQQFYQE